MTQQPNDQPARVTVALEIPELTPGTQQVGSAIDEQAMAEWFDKAMKAWMQRNGTLAPAPAPPTPEPAGKEDKAPTPMDLHRKAKAAAMKEGAISSAGRDIIQAVNTGGGSVVDASKNAVKSAISSAIAGGGKLGAVASGLDIGLSKAGEAWQVAKAGAGAIEAATAIAPALTSMIPGMGGAMPNNAFSQAATGLGNSMSAFLSTITATQQSTAKTAEVLGALANAKILDTAMKKDKSLGLRIAAREGARARLDREINVASLQRTAEGMAEAGGEGAIYAAGQMFDAIAANPAKLMGQFMSAAKAMWGVASSELSSLIWGR